MAVRKLLFLYSNFLGILSFGTVASGPNLHFSINQLYYSGFHYEEENHRVGGVIGSYHLLGMAVGIHVKDFLLFDLLLFAQEISFTGIGFYEKENFLHLDVRPGKKRVWKGTQLIGY